MPLRDYLKKIISKDSEAPEHFVNDGSTGVQIFSGQYQEEYLAEFQTMPDGIDTYDKMRRSDYQVAMLLSGVKNPIVSANWGVEAVDDSDEEKEIADFVKFCLFEDIAYPDGTKKKTFAELLTESLTCIDFGYALFEPIYKVVMDHEIWGNYIGLRDVAYRSQKSIYEWNLNHNGSIKNIRQRVDGDLDVDILIPGENIMCITNQKEGDNYEGISMLRPIFGNWKRKNFYFKMQAMGIERCATGILTGTVPLSAQEDDEQIKMFKDILRDITSHQKNYIIKPEGFEIEITKIDYDADKVEKSIDAEDRRMAKRFLSGFLELGLGGQAGSQSLGKDLSTIFLNGIEIFSNNIANSINCHIVKKLVDAKYGKRSNYPIVKATDVNNKGGKERAEVAALLKNAGIIHPSDQLEDTLNRDFDFPVITKEQKEERELLKQQEKAAEQERLQKQFEINNAKNLSDGNHAQFAKEENASTYIHGSAKGIHTLMEQIFSERSREYVKKIEKQFNREKAPAKRRKILQDTDIPGRRDYKQKLRLQMAMIADDSTRKVLKELKMLNVKFDEFSKILKTVPLSLRDKLRTTIDAIITDQDTELKKRLFFIASQKLDTTDSVDALIKDMQEAANKYTSSSVINVAATNAVSGTVNSARNAVFQTPEVFDEIDSFIIVNPSPEAAICRNLVGRVFSKEEYKTADLPPYHHNCETTVRAQLKGEPDIQPINPIGLTPTGDEEQIAKIMKSKTFDDGLEKSNRIKDLNDKLKQKDAKIKRLEEADDILMQHVVKAISDE